MSLNLQFKTLDKFRFKHLEQDNSPLEVNTELAARSQAFPDGDNDYHVDD